MGAEQLSRGRLGIPPALEKALPWWLRYKTPLVVSPLAVAAIFAMIREAAILAAALLALAIAAHIGAFWVARTWLRRHGHWTQGTWYAETLPSIYRLRGAFLAAMAVAFAGGYIILAAGVRNTYITVVTVVALALVVPFYVWLSLAQGYVGSDMGNIDFREKNPGRFWLGLFTYSTGMAVLLAVTAIFVIRHGT